jgi:tetratricopeptide (TPR) repeat protein
LVYAEEKPKRSEGSEIKSSETKEVLDAEKLKKRAKADVEIWKCKLLLDFEPNNPKIHLRLARLYSYIDDFESAIKEYRKVLSLQPNNVDARLELAKVLDWTNKHKQAEEEYKKVIGLDSRIFDAHYGLGLIYCWQNQWEEAINTLQDALKIQPQHLSARLYLAKAYFYAEKFRAAKRECKRVLNINPMSKDAKEILKKCNEFLTPKIFATISYYFEGKKEENYSLGIVSEDFKLQFYLFEKENFLTLFYRHSKDTNQKVFHTFGIDYQEIFKDRGYFFFSGSYEQRVKLFDKETGKEKLEENPRYLLSGTFYFDILKCLRLEVDDEFVSYWGGNLSNVFSLGLCTFSQKRKIECSVKFKMYWLKKRSDYFYRISNVYSKGPLNIKELEIEGIKRFSISETIGLALGGLGSYASNKMGKFRFLVSIWKRFLKDIEVSFLTTYQRDTDNYQCFWSLLNLRLPATIFK